MSNILVVAPHPDDETLGMGGTITKLIERGHNVYWLIITVMTEAGGFSEQQIAKRAVEISNVAEYYNFKGVFQFNYPATQLNFGILGDLIKSVSDVVKSMEPEEIFVPSPFDVHSDHFFVFEAMKATSKWFRFPTVKRILCYETLSETNFALGNANSGHFVANVYEDITPYLTRKKEAMSIYDSELDEHPFPRSKTAIEALAMLRGSECGCKEAEAFMLLKEIHHE